ncbi:MAG: M23 family metallopeptidase [Bacteroidota bacterium]
MTRYSHLQAVKVAEGDQVKQGEVIALSGNTGLSIGPHLHYEVRKDGKAINPVPLFNERTKRQLKAFGEAAAQDKSMD